MALIDVLRTGGELVQDDVDGLNAAIATVNAAKDVAARPFKLFEPMKSPLPERIAVSPAFFQILGGGTVGDLSQAKRKSAWLLEWHALWRWTEQDYAAVAATIEAMTLVLEKLEGRGTIARVTAPAGDGLCAIAATGYAADKQQTTIVQLAFMVHERDENPLG